MAKSRAKRNPTHGLPITLDTNFCSVCRRLAGLLVELMPPKVDASFWRVRVKVGGRKWYQSKCWPHIHIRLLCIPLVYRAPFSYNTQRVRQTDDVHADKAIGPGTLCSINGGLGSLLKFCDRSPVKPECENVINVIINMFVLRSLPFLALFS